MQDKQTLQEESDLLPRPGRAFGWFIAFLGMMGLSILVYSIAFTIFLWLTRGALNPDEISELFNRHLTTLNGLTGAGFAQYLMLLPLLIYVANFKTQAWYRTFSIHKVPAKTFAIWGGIWVLYLLLISVFEIFFEVPVDDFILQMNGSKHFLWSIVVVILAPVTEEFIFRGYLFKAWRQTRLGFAGTLILTSVLFTLMHAGQYGWFALAQVFSLAVLLGFAREKTGSILTPIFIHFLQNLLSTIVITYLGLA